MSKRGLRCRQVQADEIWTYVGKKENDVAHDDDPQEVGDQYVYVAMDSETKLIPCFVWESGTSQTLGILCRIWNRGWWRECS